MDSSTDGFFRGRRLRRSAAVRALAQETDLSPAHLVLPLFITPGKGLRREVGSMPGVYQTSVDEAVRDAERAARLGLGGVILFGLPESKDAEGSGAWAADGPVQQAVRAIKDAAPELGVVTDVCLCEYTSHGQCGVVREGTVDNDRTLPLLARTAQSHAEAGADVIAPSDMMDGRVGAIRGTLDEGGWSDLPVLSYAVKYASAFYGPFRDAADNAPTSGDRRGYQMDPANVREAIREVVADIEEGADMVMVKPAVPYLDVIREVRAEVDVPVFGYQVSGEYAMAMAADARGWLDADAVLTEMLLSVRRAGADRVVSYYAARYAERVAAP